MGELQFREARRADADNLLRIKRAAIDAIAEEHYDRHKRAAWRPDDARETFANAVERTQFDVLLAVADSEPAGYGVLNADAGRVDALFVRPDHEREGIASSLLGQLEMRARMSDIETLTVVASTNAAAFYESRGYHKQGTESRTIDGVEIAFVRMGRSISDE
jgi:putative acetyltransferase